jgi:flagellin
MRIDKSSSDRLAQGFSRTEKDNAKVLHKLSTGKRINTASDDAASLAVAREFEKQIRAYRNAAENIQAGMSAMSIADGASDSIGDMLQRQRELAVQSANGAYGQDERDALDKEFQSLSQEIDRISKSTDFNGQHLLDGTGPLADGTGKIQSGSDAGDTVTLTASDLSLNGLGSGSASLQNPAAALQALGSIDSAMRKVLDNRATQGGLSNALEYEVSNNQTQQVNLTQSLSNIEDLDYAQGLTERCATISSKTRRLRP